MKRRAKGGKRDTVTVGNIVVRIYSRTRQTTTGDTRTIFEVADYTTGARRLRGFTNHAEAIAEADKIARLLSSGEATAATMRNSEAASYGRATELLRPTGASLEVAASVYAKSFEILGGDLMIEAAKFYARHRGDKIEQRKVAQVVGELIAAREARGKSDRYIQDLRSRLNRFAASFSVNIATVTAADVQRWLDKLKLSGQTVRNFRTVLGTLFTFAEQRGYILKGSNPVSSTEKVAATGGDIEVYAPEEIARLLASASPEFLPCLAIGAFAGLRSAEIERLDWEDVDLPGRLITIGADKAKTASRRVVPILDNLAAWLAPYAKRQGRLWCGSHEAFYQAQAETAAATAVAAEPAKDIEAIEPVKWKSNACRHSFASYRLVVVQSAAQVALELGNSASVVFKHYRQLVRPEAARAWFAIRPETPANVVSVSGASYEKEAVN